MSHTHRRTPNQDQDASVVGLALAALRTDLTDRLSSDPEGLFRTLRGDVSRIAMFGLLARLTPADAADLLRWIARNTPRPDSTEIMLRAGLSPAGGRLAATERRAVFQRILDPARLALLLDLFQPLLGGKEPA